MADQGTFTPDAHLTCLHCGYDLRMITSEICPECGQAIERDVDQVSRIPWVHRTIIGRIRGYCRTVWLVTQSTSRLAAEMHRPVDVAGAKRFWLWTATLSALPLMTIYVLAWIDTGSMNLDPPSNLGLVSARDSDWNITQYFDLQLPWLLGVHFSPIVLGLIWLTVSSNLGVATYLFDLKSLSSVQRSRGISLAYYTSGCMAWFPIFAFVGVILGGLAKYSEGASTGRHFLTVLITILPFGLGCALSLFTYWIRITALHNRLTHGGIAKAMLTLCIVPLLWMLSTVFWLGLIPWLLGYAWILLQSW